MRRSRRGRSEGSRPRRVLIIVQNLSVPLDRRVWMECRALVAAGYGVSVICPRGPGEGAFEELEGVRIHRYAAPPPARGPAGYLWEFVYCWMRTSWLALRISRRERFDAIQACNPPDTYFALAAPYKLAGRRFVFDQHDLNPEVYVSRFERPNRVLLFGLRTLEKLTYRTADHVISTNDSYRRVALERGRKRPADVTVVRSGPDVLLMRRGDPRPELRRGKRHLLVYLGIMGPQDGVDLALRALRVLVDEYGRDDFHAAFLGFGDCYDDLVSLCGELGLDDRVTFTGRADLEMISAYLSTAALGLDPDPMNPLNDVSTMNKVMEYMAFELPTVAFDLTETRVSAAGAATYAEPNDVRAFAKAVDALLDDPAARTRMGAEGRRRVEDVLAWEHQAGPYVDVYRRLIGDPREP